MISDEYPQLDISVSKDSIRESLPDLVAAIRPHWIGKQVLTEDKSNGFCNYNVRVYTDDDDDDDDFLIRIINEKIDGLRERNVKIMKYLQTYDLCPRLLCLFKNGLCMDYIKGEAIGWGNYYRAKEDRVWRNIAREMARYHGMTSLEHAFNSDFKMGKGVGDDLIEKMDNFFKEATNIPESLLKKLPTVAEVRDGRDSVNALLEKLGAEKCFCHIDVNPSNLILTNDERGLRFVDFECCTISYNVHDIAWTFQSTINLTAPTLEEYPSDEKQEMFIRSYLESREEIRGGNKPVTERDVQFIKFLTRKAKLVIQLRLVVACILMSAYSPRVAEIPPEKLWGLPLMCWGGFKDTYDEIMNSQFNMD